MTPADRALLRQAGIRVPDEVKVLATVLPEAVVKKERGVTRYKKPGEDGLNDTERAYEKHLGQRKRDGEIFDYKVHAWKLLIVPGVPKSETTEGVKAVWYTPDFVVFEIDCTISIHETKGYLDQSGEAWLKFKSAVNMWPFPFFLIREVSKIKGTWDIKRYAR